MPLLGRSQAAASMEGRPFLDRGYRHRHGVSHSFHRYDGAGHAFQNFFNDANYRESQAEDALISIRSDFTMPLLIA